MHVGRSLTHPCLADEVAHTITITAGVRPFIEVAFAASLDTRRKATKILTDLAKIGKFASKPHVSGSRV